MPADAQTAAAAPTPQGPAPAAPTTPEPQAEAIRLVAVFEAIKGVVVLLAASGLLALVHRDLHEIAATLIAHAHLNPAARYPSIFLDAADRLNDANLWLLAAGAAGYALVRLVEAWGLYRQRVWAEVLAAGSGAIYLPFEMRELMQGPTALAASLLAVNLLVVVLMLGALWRRRRARV